ncbi:MAG: 2-hydroxyacyl-CoA dehydratase family protein [Eubacteriales bacterium]|nr:2-hydroxyacyl-CoA dehydratase family protein [Eubacteriales bacterium]
MIKSVEDFGKYIEKTLVRSPDKARERLVLAYKLFGLKLKYFPDKRLPLAKQKAAVYLNKTIVDAFENPENLALVNIFMPCEILEAMEIVPMCVELLSSFITGTWCEAPFVEAAKQQGISNSYCSYHKVFLGTAYSQLMRPPEAIINTSFVCDANNITFRELASTLDVPHFYIDVPTDQSEESIQYVAGQLKESASFLEEVTGKTLDENKLKATVARSKDTIALFQQVLEHKRNCYLPSDVTSELYEIYLTHNGLGTNMSYDYAKTFLHDFEGAKPFKGIKILWLHTIPHWQGPLLDLFNFNEDCQIIASDMNFENFVEMDPEKPYESMARRLVYSHWASGKARVDQAVSMGKKLNVDGVVCFCQWGCKQTMGLSGLFKEAFEAEGIPLLVLDGDGVDKMNSSDGQVSTRLNAFIEIVKSRKHGE